MSARNDAFQKLYGIPVIPFLRNIDSALSRNHAPDNYSIPEREELRIKIASHIQVIKIRKGLVNEEVTFREYRAFAPQSYSRLVSHLLAARNFGIVL